MELKIKKGFGIRNSIKIKSNLDKIIIFAPNGIGKSSIRNLFEYSKKGEYNNFGIEKDGTKESLIVDSNNMEDLSKKKILVVSDEYIEKILNYENIISGYIEEQNISNGIKAIFNAYDSFVEEVYQDYKEDFSQIINEELRDLFSNELTDENKFQFVELVEKLRTQGNPKEVLETQKKLMIIKNDLKLIENAQFILKSNKEISLKEICEKFKNKVKGYDVEQKTIFDLFKNIIEKKLENNFAFRKNYSDNFIPIKEIYQEFENVIEKGTLSKDDLPIFISAMTLFDKYNISKRNKSISVQKVKEIKNKVINLEREHAANVLSKKPGFEAVKKDLDIALKEFTNSYNKIARKINNKLGDDDNLIWKFNIDKIKTPFDEKKINVVYQNNSLMPDNLKDGPSSEQKRILAISLFLLNSEKYEYIILDDPINSLDSNNVFAIINNFNNLKSKTIILTHNFSLVNKMSFSQSANPKFDLFFMDSIENCKPFVFKDEWINVKSTYNLLRNIPKEKLFISKYVLLSSVLYEHVNEYTYNDNKFHQDILHSKYLLNLKDAANKFGRHWKGYDLTPLEYYNNVFKNEFNNNNKIIFNKKSVFYDLDINSTNSKNFNIENLSLKDYFSFESVKNILSMLGNINDISLLDYICIKYLISLTIRYETEKYILNLNPRFLSSKNTLKNWNNNKIFGLNPTLLNKSSLKGVHKETIFKIFKINNRVHFINHLDNLKWIPILEVPIHKQIMDFKKLEELINSIN